MKKIKNIIINTLFISSIVTFSSLLVTTFFNDCDKNKASVFGYQCGIVVSKSMVPTLEVGDVYIAKRVDLKEVKVGDIITYEYGKKVIIHRVIKKNDNYVLTKGDNNDFEDGVVINNTNLISKVIRRF